MNLSRTLAASQVDESDRSSTSGEPTVSSEYLLVCEAASTAFHQGRWHFTLEAADGTPVFDAGDEEAGDLNRLTLLAAVRGLESIEGASSVTLLSNNRYLIRSLTDSLPRWRQNNFVWEHFGRRMEVQHADLWRRISRALMIHRVEACLISSRLISTGSDAPAKVRQSAGADEGQQLRIDAPHNPRRRAGRESLRQPPVPPRHDRLRRWLLAGSASAAPSQHRFTAADLVRSTD